MVDLEFIEQEAKRARRAANRIIKELKEEPEPPPPPPPLDMLVGLHSTRIAYTEQIGRQWDILRLFNRGTFGESISGRTQNYLSRETVVHESFKTSDIPMDTAELARFRRFLTTIPPAAEYWLTLWHEPDQDRRVAPGVWAGLQEQLVIETRLFPNVTPVGVLTGWGLHQSQANGKNMDYLQAIQHLNSGEFYLGIDCYNWPEDGRMKNLWENYTAQTVNTLLTLNWPWLLAETATYTNDAQWYSRNITWAEDNGALAFECFDEDKPQENVNRTWEQSDEQLRDTASV